MRVEVNVSLGSGIRNPQWCFSNLIYENWPESVLVERTLTLTEECTLNSSFASYSSRGHADIVDLLLKKSAEETDEAWLERRTIFRAQSKENRRAPSKDLDARRPPIDYAADGGQV